MVNILNTAKNTVLKKWALSLVVILNILFSCNPAFAAAIKNSSDIQNLSIIVPSYDKYAEVWPPFFTLFFKYWPENTKNIYLISNEKTFTHPRVKSILIKNEKSWSDNMLFALEQIPNDYVMIILDDFLITSPVQHQKIAELFEVMKKEKAAYLELRATPVEKNHPIVADLGYLAKEAPYRVSLQVAIWEKKVLKQLLKSGESAWSFEIEGTERSRKLPQAFMSITAAASPAPISYLGAISRGYWGRDSIAFLESEGIPVERTLPISGAFRDWMNGPFRNFVSKNLVQPVKDVLGLKQVLPETFW